MFVNKVSFSGLSSFDNKISKKTIKPSFGQSEKDKNVSSQNNNSENGRKKTKFFLMLGISILMFILGIVFAKKLENSAKYENVYTEKHLKEFEKSLKKELERLKKELEKNIKKWDDFFNGKNGGTGNGSFTA